MSVCVLLCSANLQFKELFKSESNNRSTEQIYIIFNSREEIGKKTLALHIKET